MTMITCWIGELPDPWWSTEETASERARDDSPPQPLARMLPLARIATKIALTYKLRIVFSVRWAFNEASFGGGHLVPSHEPGNYRKSDQGL
jgi:hypothetical protein